MFVYVVNSIAVPAYNKNIKVVTVTGEYVSIRMFGDEHFGYALSEDELVIINDGETWKYATTDDKGNIVVSKYDLAVVGKEDDGLLSFKMSGNKVVQEDLSINLSNRKSASSRFVNKSKHPITGERHALVILMEFRDVRFKKSIAEFDAVFNQIDDGNRTNSVRGFYKFASQGQVDYISDIYGPYTSQYDMKYYGQNSLDGNKDLHASELCTEAIAHLPKGIDYSQYDNDKDGIIDNVHIVYAGYGEESAASSNTIWAHEYPYRIFTRNQIGYDLAGYSCTPELRGNMGSKITNIGVICHELGHALGANDYYDTNYNEGGSYDGTGEWDVMGSGSWNEDGASPANFNPYVRAMDFGWSEVVDLRTDQNYELESISYNSNPSETPIYRLRTNNDSDYFLLENRQQVSYDKALPSSGLMIYHVHPNIDKLSSMNSINNTHPQGFFPVCALNSNPSKRNYGKINSADCAFPANNNVRSFTNETTPSCKAWDGSVAVCEIYNIYQKSNGNITFSTYKAELPDDDTEDPEDNEEIEYEYIYSESFENGIPGSFSQSTEMGSCYWETMPNISSALSQKAPSASDGKRLIGVVLSKGKYIADTTIESCNITVETGKQYTFAIDVQRSKSESANSSILGINVNNGGRCVVSQSVSSLSDDWQTITLPFTAISDTLDYSLNAHVVSGGLYVDNIRILCEKESALTPVKVNCNAELYDLSGRKTPHFNKGIYIRNMKKYIIR